MDEMKLLEDFCAAESPPHPGWHTRSRSSLTTSISAAGANGRPRARGHWWSRLPARPRRTISRSRGARGWLTPLAAAGAVVVAVAVPLALFHGPGSRPVTHPAQTATATGPDGTPAYYLATPPQEDYAEVVSTATGKTLAKVIVPGTELTAWSAAADDHTFLLTESKPRASFPFRFVLVHFHPRTRTVTLTTLNLHPAQVQHAYTTYMLSPDATKVAISRYAMDPHSVSVTIATLATGASRTWTLPIALEPNTVAGVWATDSQRVEVTWQDARPLREYTTRVGLSTPGTRLPQPRTLALPTKPSYNVATQWAAPDGELFFIIGSTHAPAWNLTAYSAQTGELRHLFGPFSSGPDELPMVCWSSDDGQTLIICAHNGGIGVLSHGRYTPLPSTGLARLYLVSLIW